MMEQCLVLVCIGLLSTSSTSQAAPQTPGPERTRAIFEQDYMELVDELPPPGKNILSGDLSPFTESPAALKIRSLGVPVLPLVVEKMETDPRGAYYLSSIFQRIARIEPQCEWSSTEGRWVCQEFSTPVGSNLHPWVHWWREGRRNVDKQFGSLYSQWRMRRQAGEEDAAHGLYRRMRGLGIAVLPCMIEEVRAGDTTLIPDISRLTDNQVRPDATSAKVISWWEANKQNWILPAPTAQATRPVQP